MPTKPAIIELNMNELEDLHRRIEAKELRDDDYQTIQTVIHSYAHLFQMLGDKNTSIARLRKMLFGLTTEKAASVLGKQESKTPSPPVPEPESRQESSAALSAMDDTKAAPKNHGRNSAEVYQGGKKMKVPHPSLEAGDACPKCGQGTVYETARPGVLVRFTGQPPIQVKVYSLQKLRCGLCGEVFTAPPPKDAGSSKYDPTVGSMIALLKYGLGMPLKRFEGLQGNLQVPLPASTQWDILHAHAEPLEPVFMELIRQAAQGEVVHNDDTTVRILALMDRQKSPVLAEEAVDACPEKETPERTGLFTSGIVSTREGRKIALFFSGRRHAGENLAEVLALRDEDLPPPIQMCDALSRNLPKNLQTIVANCLTHGRRKFVDEADRFPEECRHVIESLGVVYHNDAIAREKNLSPTARRHFHQCESGPVLEGLHAWMKRQLEDRLVEPNSSLGVAISYMLKRWDRLTLFLRVPGAPLDNNICERALKKAILHRKNAYFYKTPHGAHVGDLFMSLIHTCELGGVNPFDYLTELERHAEELSGNPAGWMPWNYRETLLAVAPVE